VALLVELLGTFAASPKYIQNHSKDFVALFLRFLAFQYDPETLRPKFSTLDPKIKPRTPKPIP